MFEKLDSISVQDIVRDGQNCLARKEAAKFIKTSEEIAAEPTLKKRGKVTSKILLHRSQQTTPTDTPKTILAVDDNPDIVEYLVSIFRERGYAAMGAASA